MDLSSILSTKRESSTKRIQCEKCKYYNQAFVPSYIGDSDIVIVGDAPSGAEVTSGVPFTGEGGQLLRKTLAEVGFDPDRISYVHAVKCQPTNAETPDADVKTLCAKLFLKAELQQIKPRLVVLAGATALSAFFPKDSITTRAGSFITQDDMKFLPVFHPAYCLKNPTTVPKFRMDLKRAHQYLYGNLLEGKDYKILSTVVELQHFKELLLKQEVITFDIETNMMVDVLDPKFQVWTLGFGWEIGKAICIPLDHPESVNVEFKDMAWQVCKEIMASKVGKVAHNAKFDIKGLQKFGVITNNLVADPMIMSHLLDENRHSNGLKQLTAEFIGGYVNEWSEDLMALGLYNCEDCDNTLALYRRFLEELQKLPKLLTLFQTVTMPMVEVILDMELFGVYVDIKFSAKLAEQLKKKLKVVEESIEAEFPQTLGINLGSNQQLQKLFVALGYPKIKETATHQMSTDGEVLEELASQGYGLADYLVKMREYKKSLSTYVEKFPEIVRSDGRVHGEFNIIGTVSGRLSSNSPNLQNIPRDLNIRKMFAVPEGYLMLNIDASQAELRVGGVIANEQNMIKAYQSGQDLHRLTAARIYNVPIEAVTKKQRHDAKSCNFGFLYGQKPEGYQRLAKKDYGLNLSLDACRKFREKHFEAYPGLIAWYERIRLSLKVNGYVEYPTGRRRRFPQIKGQSLVPDNIFNQAVNAPVQGSSSDIVEYTMVQLKRYLDKTKIPARMTMTVHDSVMLQIQVSPDRYEEEIIEEVKDIAKNNIPAKFPWLIVPMVFDFSVGKNWGELVERKEIV